MKNIIILGASGNIAGHVIDILVKKNDINLTLLLRSKKPFKNKDVSGCHVIEGDLSSYNKLKETIDGQDSVYANPAEELEAIEKDNLFLQMVTQ